MDKYCVIGKSLAHTLSPEIHRLFGSNYGKVEIASESELNEFIKSQDYCGFNVTIPYKEKIMELLDEIDDVAKEVGAVNTVVKLADAHDCQKDGVEIARISCNKNADISNPRFRLIGYNTDVGGMEYALKVANIKICDKNVLILGSGGTSKTAIFVCKKLNAKSINVVSRSGEIDYQNCYQLSHTNVIINTTPVGMFPYSQNMPIDLEKFAELDGVFDVVYNPLQTRLVASAKALGVCSSNGLNMLVEQARLAHNIFVRAENLQVAYSKKCVEQTCDDETTVVCGEEMTASVAKSILRDRQNIALIGMAGSGKSTIGHMLALALGREFVDTDQEIETSAHMSIPEIFEKHGESYFRQLEMQILERECSKLGRVISLGGGAVVDLKNQFFVASNSVVVLINRPLDNLATANRPLSPDIQTAKKLFEKRIETYNSFADITIDNNTTLENAVIEIVKRMKTQ